MSYLALECYIDQAKKIFLLDADLDITCIYYFRNVLLFRSKQDDFVEGMDYYKEPQKKLDKSTLLIINEYKTYKEEGYQFIF